MLMILSILAAINILLITLGINLTIGGTTIQNLKRAVGVVLGVCGLVLTVQIFSLLLQIFGV